MNICSYAFTHACAWHCIQIWPVHQIPKCRDSRLWLMVGTKIRKVTWICVYPYKPIYPYIHIHVFAISQTIVQYNYCFHSSCFGLFIKDIFVMCTLPQQFLMSKKYNANIKQYRLRLQYSHNLYQILTTSDDKRATLLAMEPSCWCWHERTYHAHVCTTYTYIYRYIYIYIYRRPKTK